MFQDELDSLVADLGLSQGELLQMAREIAHDDNVRTIDRLTRSERNELILALEIIRLRSLAPA